jgi:hypothetical protein
MCKGLSKPDVGSGATLAASRCLGRRRFGAVNCPIDLLIEAAYRPDLGVCEEPRSRRMVTTGECGHNMAGARASPADAIS